jgi:hypothetical protein
VPAGFYRIIREGSPPTDNAVFVNKTGAFLSSTQAQLLCAECEERFCQGGGDGVLKYCWRSSRTCHSTRR